MRADQAADPATDPEPTAVLGLGPAAAPPPRPGQAAGGHPPGAEDTTVEYAVVQFDGGPERPVASVVAGFCDVHTADEHAAEHGYGDYVVAPATMVRPA